MSRTHWLDDAACAKSGIDPEEFFPNAGQLAVTAISTCEACTVRARCLEVALENQYDDGIWGGMRDKERRALQRAARKARATYTPEQQQAGLDAYLAARPRHASDEATYRAVKAETGVPPHVVRNWVRRAGLDTPALHDQGVRTVERRRAALEQLRRIRHQHQTAIDAYTAVADHFHVHPDTVRQWDHAARRAQREQQAA